MSKLIEMRQEKADAVTRMRAILDLADNDKRTLTDEETNEYATLEKSLDVLDEKIAREEKLTGLEEGVRSIKKPMYKPGAPAIIGKAENDEEFRDFGEFLRAVVTNPRDKRLEYVESNIERREQSVVDGTKGGFMVPPQFRQTLLEVPIQEAVLRARCQTIPAGDPPDSPITIPTMDQSAGKGKLSGVDVVWVDEGGTKTETDMYLKEVTLTPHELAGYVVATDKLLRNWTAAGAIIANKLRQAMVHAIETTIMSGDGVGKPMGLLNSGATIKIARNTASSILWTDIRAMYARALFGGNLVWVGSQTILPQIMNMKDDSSALVWQPNARDGEPNRMLGIPFVINNRNPVLGAQGDLALLDLNYYLIKEGSGPYVAASEHVYFTSNKTVIKAFLNIDGQSWLSTSLPLEGSTANTVSPFVVMTT